MLYIYTVLCFFLLGLLAKCLGEELQKGHSLLHTFCAMTVIRFYMRTVVLPYALCFQKQITEGMHSCSQILLSTVVAVPYLTNSAVLAQTIKGNKAAILGYQIIPQSTGSGNWGYTSPYWK